jgi:hypothetical protein
MKGVTVLVSVNRVVFVGTIGRNGVEVRYSNSGSAIASFMLCLGELGTDGKPHTTMIPCQVVGRKAEAVSEIPAGAVVAFDGKVDKRKRGEQYEVICTGFDLTVISTGVEVSV